MRRNLLLAAAGLASALFLASATAREPGSAGKSKKIAKPAAKEAATCGEYGTTVEFEKDHKAAAAKAKEEGKLVMVLHVSGNFETPDFT